MSIAPPTLTREQLAELFGVNQGYLGYLLKEKRIPLPVRINGEILWYADEVEASKVKMQKWLDRRAELKKKSKKVPLET